MSLLSVLRECALHYACRRASVYVRAERRSGPWACPYRRARICPPQEPRPPPAWERAAAGRWASVVSTPRRSIGAGALVLSTYLAAGCTIDFVVGSLDALPSCDAHFAAGARVSGLYQIDPDGDSSVRTVRCVMTPDGGYTSVLDFNAASDPCPDGLPASTDPLRPGCGAALSGEGGAIVDVLLPSYTEVMGTALANVFGSPDAFASQGRPLGRGVGENYVDGVSITDAATGEHVMTWAAAFNDQPNYKFSCPCVGGEAMPTFVGGELRCDAAQRAGAPPAAWLPAPVWSGIDGPTSPSCQVEAGGTPIVKRFDGVRSGPLRVRVMVDQPTLTDEDLSLYKLELLVR